jgi:transposase
METVNTSDVVLYFSDEMRYGLMSNLRRSWSKIGARAVLPHQQAFENRYLYSAVSPISGESFHLLGIDDMDSEATKVFLTELKKKHPYTHVVVVWDNAPCHRPKAFREIPGLTVISLPSYSPELNPTERFFEEMRRVTANRVFESIAQQEELITNAVNHWSNNTDAMKQLLGYAWILEQCSVVS